MAHSWSHVIGPFLAPYRRYDTVLDLACGHGRNSVFLRAIADRLILMDIQPGNIAVCQQRFEGAANISYIVNDGLVFSGVADHSVDLVYCFDAMVHFDSDVVRSYLSDLTRILAPGGLAFLHHSNYVGGEDWLIGPANRNFMSKELMAHYAGKECLRVVKQQTIAWSGIDDLDCLSLLAPS
jgi:ubiquinone/menaquinone biosynthesis C-methylase UbiE